MKEKPTGVSKREKEPLYERVRQILQSARTSVARTVNTTQVVANWLIGREIVEEEQKGRRRAGYREELPIDLSERLSGDYGKGWSVRKSRVLPQILSGIHRFAGKSEIERTAFDFPELPRGRQTPHFELSACGIRYRGGDGRGDGRDVVSEWTYFPHRRCLLQISSETRPPHLPSESLAAALSP